VIRAPALTPHDPVFLPLFLGLIALAWMLVAAWGLSPWAGYLDHDWTRLGLLAILCRLSPAAGPLLGLGLGALAWLLMSAAMMLPTTLPLVAAFRGLAGRERHGGRLILLLVAGYLAVWFAFGLLVHGVGLGLAAAAAHSPWLAINGWMVAAAVLLLAGLYQFSALKAHCLHACRSPVKFILDRWSKGHPQWRSFRLGLAHGVYCLGCCWALMLLMFAFGAANLAWMLLLAAIMAVEKNSPWGRHIGHPLGGLLIAGATLLTLHAVVAI
jgi:predicted metal-binding membrane protein